MLAACVLFVPGIAWCQPRTYPLAIPAQPLDRSLVALASQAGLSIGASAADFTRYTAPAVAGKMSVSAALNVLLKNTPYDFEILNSATVLIFLRRTDDTPSPGAQMAALGPQPALRAAAIDMGSIMVTATKRRTAENSLPYSISVLTRRTLGQTGVANTSDIALMVSGVTVTNLGPGRNKIIVRGISDGVLPGRTQSTVGIYLDEMRVSSDTPDPDLKLVDIAQAEVLRGPQGSLYGAGSISGIYKIVTNKPVMDVFATTAEAGLSAAGGGGIGYVAQTVVNVPVLSDKLAARVVLYDEQMPGYLDNPALGATNTNSSRRYGGRMLAAWQASSAWHLLAGVASQNIESADAQYGTPVAGKIMRTTSVPEPRTNDFIQLQATLTGAVPWATITSSTGWIQRDFDTTYDATQAAPDFGLPAQTSAVFMEETKQKTWVHETRLVSPPENRFQWLAGVFWSNSNTVSDSRYLAQRSAAPIYTDVREEGLNELAAFGEASLKLFRNIHVTFGGRVTHSNRTSESDVAQNGQLQQFPAQHLKDTSFAPKTVLTYQPSESFMLYFQSNEGYRVGGFNRGGTRKERQTLAASQQPYARDQLLNSEIGVKFSAFAKRLKGRAAVYDSSWENIQTDALLPSGLMYIANAGKGRNIGIELEASYQISDAVTLAGHALFNNPELTEASPAANIKSDGILPGVAKFSGGARLAYDGSLSDTVSLFGSASLNYTGRSKTAFEGPVAADVGAYLQTQLHAGLRWRTATLSATLHNILNDKNNTLAYGNPFSFGKQPQVTPQKPRTLTVSLGVTF